MLSFSPVTFYVVSPNFSLKHFVTLLPKGTMSRSPVLEADAD